jgi:hypothetical protein
VNVRAINMSWGGGGYSAALGDAIQAAGNAGILCVAAAGNSGRNNDATPSYPASYDASNLLAVAATDSRDNLASFSNYGAATVDLAAPGVSIVSTYPGNRYATLSGTSMATPQVAGVAALAWSLAPSATVAEIKAAILGGVDHVASLNGKVLSGGRLNAYNTLRLLSVPAAQSPVIASLSAAPGTIAAGSALTLTAGGVTDPDGRVTSVWFYQDSNASGSWDAADRGLGNATTIASQSASVALNTSGYAPGTYTVFARAQDNSGQWSGPVSTTFQVVAPDDHGNTAARATAIDRGGTVAGQIETGGDRDWFALDVVAGRTYVFRTQLGTLRDSVLTLYDRNGVTAIATNDDSPGLGLASQITWTASASGTYCLEVKAFTRSQTGSYSLDVRTRNSAPVLATIGDQSMLVRQDTISVSLNATDTDGDRLTFTADVMPSTSVPGAAYDLDQRLGLYSTGAYLQNYLGAQEKWIRGAGSKSYYLLPNGELHQWAGTLRASPLVASLSGDYWANPQLLCNAQPATPAIPADAVSLSLQGNVLTINPRDGLLGQFLVRVVVSDGVYTDTKTFKVTVANNSSNGAAASLGSFQADTIDPAGSQAGPAYHVELAAAVDAMIRQQVAAETEDGASGRIVTPSVSTNDYASGSLQTAGPEWLAVVGNLLDRVASKPLTSGPDSDASGWASQRAHSAAFADFFGDTHEVALGPADSALPVLDHLFALLAKNDLPTPEGIAG